MAIEPGACEGAGASEYGNLLGPWYRLPDDPTFTDPFGLDPDTTGNRSTVANVSTAVGSGGSSLTVTVNYEPLNQEQADWVVDAIAIDDDVTDALVGAGVAMILSRLPGVSRASLPAGVAVGMASARGLDYTPHVGDRITTTTTVGYGSGVSNTTAVVTRADGRTETYNRALWRPR